MIRTFIQMMSLLLTFSSSIFLLKGNLGLSPQVIADLVSTKLNYNGAVLNSLASQAVDTRIGLALLLFSFVFQLINSLWPMRYTDFSINRKGLFLSFIVSGVVTAISFSVSIHSQSQLRTDVLAIISERK